MNLLKGKHTHTHLHIYFKPMNLYSLICHIKIFRLSLYFSFSYIIFIYNNGVGNAYIPIHVCIHVCPYAYIYSTLLLCNFFPFTHAQRSTIEFDISKFRIWHERHVVVARDGYIIYCYGDCNRKFEEALQAQRKTGDGDDLMKAIWLDIYNEQLTTRRKWLISAHLETHTYIYTYIYVHTNTHA